MTLEQTIFLPPRATAFRAVCDACLAGGQANWDDYAGAAVDGSLRLEDAHGYAECRRGHVIRVERAAPALAGVIR